MLKNHRAGLRWITITLVLLICLGQTSLAQSSADQKKTLTLEEAIDFALKNYPAVRAALDALPSEQRQVIDLGFYGGYSHSQIAERLATPLGTVKKRMRSGLKRLRAALDERFAGSAS